MVTQDIKPAFRFKQFSIVQQNVGMKLNTDGVLLGAWTSVTNRRALLDIGTGTGIIALMLAQKSNEKARIDAVEIDPLACLDAFTNINNCPFYKKLSLFNSSIQDFILTKHRSYDCIVSNPPYFTDSTSPSTDQKAMGKHTVTLTHTELIDCVAKLLTDRGKFSVILPDNEGRKMIKLAKSRALYPNKITEVSSVVGRGIERLLIEFGRTDTETQIDHLVIKDIDGTYTQDYIDLTKDFYLKF
jgi:tRNA1Val (adenine37-N6)-methyltransferase